MNILVTGRGRSGSWEMRGRQLGEAICAKVSALAAPQDYSAADICVVVKRTPDQILGPLRESGKPWVYDFVDAFPQPTSTYWTRDESIAWAKKHLRELNPTAVIWPTRKMKEDCDIGLPSIVLPHHHRPGIKVNPIREEIKVVGYEGRTEYLAEWHPKIDKECRSRGWRFVVNPQNLADLDIVVAVRGKEWNGYASQHWKSAVKSANAHASGTPFVAQPSSGYEEMATGAEYWCGNHIEMRTCFDWLGAQSTREHISDRFQQAAYPVEKAAETLKQFLQTLI